MKLTAQQEDTLKEIVNIGYGRAAAALSELTAARVTIEVPMVYALELDQVEAALRRVFPSRVTCVNQVFSGPIRGNAVLLLDERSAALLSTLAGHAAAELPEAVTEIGNIVLNACLGVFGNLLQMQIQFTVPDLTVSTVESFLRSIQVTDASLSHSLLVQTRFSLRESNVKGYMAIIVGVTSFSRLMEELDRFE